MALPAWLLYGAGAVIFGALLDGDQSDEEIKYGYDEDDIYTKNFLNKTKGGYKLDSTRGTEKGTQENGRQGYFQNFLMYNSLALKYARVGGNEGFVFDDESTGGKKWEQEYQENEQYVAFNYYLDSEDRQGNKYYFVNINYLKLMYGYKGSTNDAQEILDFIVTLHADYITYKINQQGENTQLSSNDKDFIYNVAKGGWTLATVYQEEGSFFGGAKDPEITFSYQNLKPSTPEPLIENIIVAMLEKKANLDEIAPYDLEGIGSQVQNRLDADYTKAANAKWSAERIQYMINNIASPSPYEAGSAEEPSSKDIEIKIPANNLKQLYASHDFEKNGGELNAIPNRLLDQEYGYSTNTALWSPDKDGQSRSRYKELITGPPMVRDEKYRIGYDKNGNKVDQFIPVSKVSGSALDDPYNTTDNTGCILYDVYEWYPDKSTKDYGWVGKLPDYYAGLPDFIEDLKNDKKFQGLNPGEYDLLFYDAPIEYSWQELITNRDGALFKWFFDDGQSSAEKGLKKLYDDRYVMFIREFILANENTWEFASQARKRVYNQNFHRDVFSRIIADKEIARRVKRFELTIEEADKIEDSEVLNDEAEKRILGAEGEGFLENNRTPAPKAGGKYGTKEDIEKRQKFFKQCALILNLEKISTAFNQHLGNGSTRQDPNKAPFKGRFHLTRHKANQELILNNLVSPADGRIFFELPPHVVSALTPKIKLFRVENEKDKDGLLQETEFIFPTSTDLNRTKDYTRPQPKNLSIPSSFLSADFDKGEGCGLKEFSFEFNGTNPAESRNDIKATLKLYFQTFSDFLRERISSNGRKYRFVDLVIQPAEPGVKINGVDILHPNQYEPSFYRIRAELGYHYTDAISSIYSDSATLKRAIERTNRSYYLCMVDHELDIDIDGTVEVTISYRAYAETALKSLRYDALTTPELLEEKKKNAALFKKVLSDPSCGEAELRELKRAMAGEEERIRRQSLQSIIRRLLDDGKIYVGKINEQDGDQFRTAGEFTGTCRLENLGTTTPAGTPEEELKTDSSSDAVAFILRNDIPETDAKPGEDGFNYNDENDYTIQWFFIKLGNDPP